jgi:hypothetical protein
MTAEALYASGALIYAANPERGSYTGFGVCDFLTGLARGAPFEAIKTATRYEIRENWDPRHHWLAQCGTIERCKPTIPFLTGTYMH